MRLSQQPKLVTNSRSAEGVREQGVPTFSIVVPAFCEQSNLLKLYEEIVAAVTEETWELVIVDDGSTDNTWSEIFELHKQDSRVKGLRLSRNFGHQYALFAGLANAAGQAIITLDADLQHPPAIIPQLLSHWREGSKIVHTVRIDPETTPG